MKRIINYISRKPLDVKIAIISFFMIFGFFFFPEYPKNMTVFTTYIGFVFVSVGISGFFVSYVQDSQYNIFRKTTNLKGKLITISGYIIVCTVISYILATTTGLFLFIVG